MADYCSNEYCKGREECQKAAGMKDGDTVIFPVNSFYANRCPQFEDRKKPQDSQ